MADERWVQLVAGLTPAQKQIVDLLRQGHTHQEISSMLGLHVKAIQRLVRKLSEQLES
jgi:DNA-binding CsgD family transcriptional regulator